MNWYKINKKLIVWIIIFVQIPAYAGLSIAEISTHLMGPTQGFSAFVSAVAFVAGIGLLIGSAIQYRDYRKNKGRIPLSTPLTFFLLGIVMILVPLISQYSVGAQYLLHNLAMLHTNH